MKKLTNMRNPVCSFRCSITNHNCKGNGFRLPLSGSRPSLKALLQRLRINFFLNTRKSEAGSRKPDLHIGITGAPSRRNCVPEIITLSPGLMPSCTS